MRELCQRMSAVIMELNLKFMLTIQMTVCQQLCHFLTLQDQQIGFLTQYWKIRTGNLPPIFSHSFPFLFVIWSKLVPIGINLSPLV